MHLTIKRPTLPVEHVLLESSGKEAHLILKLRKGRTQDSLIIDFATPYGKPGAAVDTNPDHGGQIHLSKEKAQEMVDALQEMLA